MIEENLNIVIIFLLSTFLTYIISGKTYNNVIPLYRGK